MHTIIEATIDSSRGEIRCSVEQKKEKPGVPGKQWQPLLSDLPADLSKATLLLFVWDVSNLG